MIRRHPRCAGPDTRHQHGAVLLVGLVMLVLVMIAAVTSYNLARSGMQVVANMGYRNDAAAAAQQAIETAISSITFAEKPDAVFATSGACGDPNSLCYDIDGDGADDLTVSLAPNPICRTGRVLSTQELDLTNTEDLGCSVSAAQSFGVVGTTAPASLCAQTQWDIRAVARDEVTRTRVAITQGVGLRVPSGDIASACP
ncbi:MAG: hypothetical protein LT102_03430 [Burkholderiaceae bacterium]|nr:hypothetical protein [Burkholderiaceae bacterium]